MKIRKYILIKVLEFLFEVPRNSHQRVRLLCGHQRFSLPVPDKENRCLESSQLRFPATYKTLTHTKVKFNTHVNKILFFACNLYILIFFNFFTSVPLSFLLFLFIQKCNKMYELPLVLMSQQISYRLDQMDIWFHMIFH